MTWVSFGRTILVARCPFCGGTADVSLTYCTGPNPRPLRRFVLGVKRAA